MTDTIDLRRRNGVMQRFGGQPYTDGQRLRCPDDNGLFDGTRCATCHAVPGTATLRRAGGPVKVAVPRVTVVDHATPAPAVVTVEAEVRW